MKIDCVKLQREIRDKVYQANKAKSLREEVEAVQRRIKEKGRGHLFKAKADGPAGPGDKSSPE
jgi:hypothetical protein